MEEEVKNNYMLGVIGAVVGALIGAIPWVLVYVFANMMYSFLAILIVLGSFYGYKLTKAKIDKKLPVILSIASFISITVTMLFIIPMCLLMNEGYGFNIDYLTQLYQSEEFTTAILSDYMVSILFCLIVIGIIIYNLNKQIREGKDSKDIKLIAQDASNDNFSNEDIEKVKDIFEKNDAMNKRQTITKELVMEDLNKEFGEEKAKGIFDYLKIQQIIKKKSGKYYFSEKAQKSSWYRYGITNLKTFVIVIIIAIVLAIIIIFIQDNASSNDINTFQNEILSDTTRATTYDVGVDNIRLEFPNDIILFSTDEVAYYFGEDYANAYDCIAMNLDFTKSIMAFTYNKSDAEYTAEEYIKASLEDDNIEIIKQDISGHTFYTVESSYEGMDGNTYVESDYIYDAGDKFVCIIFSSIKGEELDANEIIK